MRKLFILLSVFLCFSFANATTECSKDGLTGNCDSFGIFQPDATHTLERLYNFYTNQTDARVKLRTIESLIYRLNQDMVSISTALHRNPEPVVTPVTVTNPVSATILPPVSAPVCQKLSQTLWEGKAGQSSTDVSNLQIYLNKFGKEKGFETEMQIVSGIYDNGTTWWVKQFQRIYGIKQTGSVGPLTLAKINSMICENNNSTQTQATATKSKNYSQLGTGEYFDDFNFDGLKDKLVIEGLGSGKIYVQTTSGGYVESDELNKILYLGERGYFNLNYADKTIEVGGSMGGGKMNKKVYRVIQGGSLEIVSSVTTSS